MAHFTYPKSVYFVCVNCGICCGDTKQKTRHILLTKADAERITAHTKQLVSTFAQEIPNKQPYIYEMYKTAESGKCLFHQDNQCTIYAARPLICRFYPFKLVTDEKGTHVFSETVECPQIRERKGKRLKQDFFEQLLKQAEETIGSAEP